MCSYGNVFYHSGRGKKILLNLMETISPSLMKLQRLLLTTLKLSSLILTYMVPLLLLGPLILPLPDLSNILTYDCWFVLSHRLMPSVLSSAMCSS